VGPSTAMIIASALLAHSRIENRHCGGYLARAAATSGVSSWTFKTGTARQLT
jgi:hypothetical protein